MTDQLENRIRQALGQRAGLAGDDDTLARISLRKGRRIIARRRITTSVAALAVLAAAIPPSLDLVTAENSRGTEMQPAESRNPTDRTPNKQDGKSTVTIDLDDLPKGEPSEVPWYEDGMINTSDYTTPVPNLPKDGYVSFAPVAEGYVVASECCGEMPDTMEIQIIGVDGSVRATWPGSSFPAVSADGQRLALTDSVDIGAMRLTLTNAKGDALEQKRISDYADPVGFVGETVFTTTPPEGGSGKVHQWIPESGELPDIAGIHSVEATSGEGLYAAGLPPRGDSCEQRNGVFSAGEGEWKLWDSCDVRINALSSDERLALGTDITDDEYPAVVLDAKTGNPLLEIRGLEPDPTMTTEPDGDILIDANVDGQSALVRCTLDGDCERVTDVLPENEAESGTTITVPGRR